MNRRIEIKVPLAHSTELEEIGGRPMIRFYMELAEWLRIHPLIDAAIPQDKSDFIKRELDSGEYLSIRIKLSHRTYDYWRRIHHLDRWSVLLGVAAKGIDYRACILSAVPAQGNEPSPSSSPRNAEQREEVTATSVDTTDTTDKVNNDESHTDEDLNQYVPKGLFQTSSD